MSSLKQPQFTISAAAAKLGLHPHSLRNYEKAGLMKPYRKGRWRYYSLADIAWIKCLVNMIHHKGISINALGKLLTFAPCWEIADCPPARHRACRCTHGKQVARQGKAARATDGRNSARPLAWL